MNTKLKPIHPSEILWEEFLVPMNRTQAHELAALMGITNIDLVMKCMGSIDLPMAQRLAAFTDTSAQLWLNLQKQYDESTNN